MEVFHETAGDDADHPGGPGGVAEDQGGGFQEGRIALDLGHGGFEDLVCEQLALRIETFDDLGLDTGFTVMGGGEEFDHGVGI